MLTQGAGRVLRGGADGVSGGERPGAGVAVGPLTSTPHFTTKRTVWCMRCSSHRPLMQGAWGLRPDWRRDARGVGVADGCTGQLINDGVPVPVSCACGILILTGEFIYILLAVTISLPSRTACTPLNTPDLSGAGKQWHISQTIKHVTRTTTMAWHTYAIVVVRVTCFRQPPPSGLSEGAVILQYLPTTVLNCLLNCLHRQRHFYYRPRLF